jgi:hypothetical protein
MAHKKNQKTGAFKSRIFKANIRVAEGNVTIEFPKSILEYIHASGKTIFWSPVNGVVQISGEKPHMVIPMLSLDEDSFMLHEIDPVVEIEE